MSEIVETGVLKSHGSRVLRRAVRRRGIIVRRVVVYPVDWRHHLQRFPRSLKALHVHRITSGYVDHRFRALPLRQVHGALFQQRGCQMAAASFTVSAAAAAAALHTAVNGHGQRRARRHQRFAGQRHQHGGSDRAHRAHRPVQSVVIFLFSTFFAIKKKKGKNRNAQCQNKKK